MFFLIRTELSVYADLDEPFIASVHLFDDCELRGLVTDYNFLSSLSTTFDNGLRPIGLDSEQQQMANRL